MGQEIPQRLVEFASMDWPGDSDRDRLELWAAARRAWAEVNGWPGGPLELIIGHFDTRRHVVSGVPLPDRSYIGTQWVEPERFTRVVRGR